MKKADTKSAFFRVRALSAHFQPLTERVDVTKSAIN